MKSVRQNVFCGYVYATSVSESFTCTIHYKHKKRVGKISSSMYTKQHTYMTTYVYESSNLQKEEEMHVTVASEQNKAC